jgi:hypothetical protein
MERWRKGLAGMLLAAVVCLPGGVAHGQGAGKALSLNGTDGFVNLGRSAVYQVGSNFTLEAWIRTSAQVWWAGIVGNVWDTGSTESGYGL